MTPIAAWIALAALVVFSGASFFFALAETSLFSLGKWQLRQLAERAPGPGSVVNRLLARPQDLLATLALGNSFANAGIVGVALWVAMDRGWPLEAVMPGLLALILFGAEVAPKTLAVRAPGTLGVARGPCHVFFAGIQPAFAGVAQTATNFVLRLFAAAVRAAAAGAVRRRIPGVVGNGLSTRARWRRAKRKSSCKSLVLTAARRGM